MSERDALIIEMRSRILAANGLMARTNLDSEWERQCPQCGKVYRLKSAEPHPNECEMEREQRTSGICSDACWDAFLSE